MQITHRQRFLARVDVRTVSECWPWTGPRSKGGYGVVNYGGQVAAHRFAYQEFVGPIPDGLFVCHACDNRACVNHAHLFLGTNQDNMDDMVQKGRSPHLPGERNPFAILTDDMVRAIITQAGDVVPLRTIAARFGVSRSTVGLICAGKTWAHITGGATVRPTKEIAERRAEGGAKLTAEQAATIAAMYRAGGWSYARLGAHFGVSRGAVNGILNGHSWRHYGGKGE